MGTGDNNKALPKAVEVAVIGGGIAGCATAWFLAKRGVPVALFEKGRIAGEQSSRNWGWVRKQGRDPLEIPAIVESLKIWQGLEAELEADLGWHQGGTAYLAETEQDLAGYESWLAEAKAYQLDSRMLSPAETDTLLGQSEGRWKGALFTPSDGRAEPAKAAPALAAAAERLGASVQAGCAVRTVETEAGQVSGIVTERGPVACRRVVCAAGVWTRLFCRNLGIDLPQLRVKASVLRTKPAPLITQAGVSSNDAAFRRRQDGGYTIACSGAVTFDLVPDLLRYGKAFWPAYQMNRRQMRLRLSGEFFRQLAQPASWGADDTTVFERQRVLDPEPDHGTLDRVLATAGRQFPQLAGIEPVERWAGMIEATPDELPVMGAAGRPEGFFIATGFSGHGFGMGPAAGLLMSEMVTEGRARLDMTPFRLSRFGDGSRLQPYDAL